MGVNENKVGERYSDAVAIIPKPFLLVLLTLHKKLDDKSIEWVVGGDLCEALRTVKMEPSNVEIATSKENLEKAFSALQEYDLTEIEICIQRLQRNAVVKGAEHPAYVRSCCFETTIGTVPTKIQSDIQYRINDWDWGDKLQFSPEYIYIVGKKTAVVPLSVECKLYQGLGWTDRVEKIRRVIERQKPQRPLTPR